MTPPGAVQNLRVEAPGAVSGAKVLWDPVAVPEGATRVQYALRWGPVGTPWGQKYEPPDVENQLITDKTAAVLTGSGFPVGAEGEVQILAFNPDATTNSEKWGPISRPVVFTVFDVQEAPEPVVQQPFAVAMPTAGDTGVGVTLEWVEGIDSVTFRLDGGAVEVPAGEPGVADDLFLFVGRPLVEGEVLMVDALARFEGRDSEPFPQPPYHVTVAAAEPEPEPEPTDNPIVSVEIMEGKVDSLIATWQDGSRAEVRRFSPWRGIFDWIMGAIWLSKKLPPEDTSNEE